MPTGNNQAAYLIITQAEVWTGDSCRPWADAVAVCSDRIVAVGSAAEVELWRGKGTQQLAGHGRLLLPGFNDAHVHFIDGGLQLDQVDLRGSSTSAEFIRSVAAHAGQVAPGDWVLGGGWDEKRWDKPVLPTKKMIDPVTRDLPVLLHRCDMHMALANSVALRLAGVNGATLDPVGGTIVRDASGEPTGILKDAAISLVFRVTPPLTAGRRLRALRQALQHAASLGVTSVQHMNPTGEDIVLYMDLDGQSLRTSSQGMPASCRLTTGTVSVNDIWQRMLWSEEALWMPGLTKRAKEDLRKWLYDGLRHQDPGVQSFAVRAVGRLERPEFLGELAPMLSASSPEVRREAANAIGQMVQGADLADRPEAMRGAAELLRKCLEKETDAAVRAGLRSAKDSARDTHMSLIRRGLSDPDWHVKYEAVSAYARSQDSPDCAALEVVDAILEGDQIDQIRVVERRKNPQCGTEVRKEQFRE